MENKQNLRIAFIVDQFPPLGTFILNQITGLIDLGHKVDVYAYENPGKYHREVEDYNLIERTHYFDFPLSKSVRLKKAFGLFIKYFPGHPIAVAQSLNFIKYGKNALILSYFFHLVPFLDKNYDIIQCQFAPTSNSFLFLRDILRTKYITTFHGWDIRLAEEFGGNIYKKLFERGDLFVAISNYHKKKLIEFGCPGHKIIRHNIGIDIDKFSPKGIYSDNSVKIVTIGRLVWEKGLEFGLKAISLLDKRHDNSNIQYVVIGNGPLRSRLKKQTHILGLENKVKFKGEMKRDDVIKLLDQVDIFLLPSIAEGTPACLMEAQAKGLPVVATKICGIPEVVVNGKTGFLVPERDAEALADRLNYLIEHPEVREKFGRFGRKFVEENFNIKKLNKQLERIYLDILRRQLYPLM